MTRVKSGIEAVDYPNAGGAIQLQVSWWFRDRSQTSTPNFDEVATLRPYLTCFRHRTAEDRPPIHDENRSNSEVITFRDLGLRAEVVDALAAQGIKEPFPIQAATVADALAGRDVCGKAKTGSGKTLAFGLPAIQTTQASKPGHPTALVLVPTRELAKQVVDVLSPIGKRMGVRVAAFYGGTSMDRQIRTLSRKIEVAVKTPGRMIDLLERG